MITKLNNYLNEKNSSNINDNFWKWFGNSKVIDADGKPLIVYHGSQSDKKFKKFNNEHPIWFTKSESYANAFMTKDGTMFKVYIKLENPIYVADVDSITNDDNMAYLSKLTGVEFSTLKRILKESNGVNLFKITNSDEFKKLMQERGYDGIEAKEAKGLSTYAVFSQNQIKDVNNDGTWDINDSNIHS